MRALYNRKGWPLCCCLSCGLVKYVEPHGTLWTCRCNRYVMTEHRNVPMQYTDANRTVYLGPSRIPAGDR